MTSNQQKAAEVIGEAYQEAMDSGTPSTWRYQIARALTDAGLLMPDLPTDNTGEMGSGEWSAGFEYEGDSDGNLTTIHQAHASAWSPGWISLSAPRRMTTDQAEAVVLALLAAVRSDRQIAASRAIQEKK